MTGKKRKALLRKARSLMEDEGLADALSRMIEDQRGHLGFLLSTLKKRHKTFTPYVLKGMSVYREPAAIVKKQQNLRRSAPQLPSGASIASTLTLQGPWRKGQGLKKSWM